MEAVAKTPEREAFYKKIDGENLLAAAAVATGDLYYAPAAQRLPPASVEIRRHPRLHDRGGKTHHRQGSRAPRADP